MKFCASHFHDLDHTLKHKGMGRFINPAHAETFAQRWLDGTATILEFDPLVVSVLEIKAKTVQMGMVCLNGDCPLCAANRALQNLDTADAWIDNISDLMLITCKTNNLLP